MKSIAIAAICLVATAFPAAAEEAPDAALAAKLQAGIEAAARKDEAELRLLGEEFKLPMADVWFASQFGNVQGAKLASFYSEMDFAKEMPKLFLLLVDKGQTEVRVTTVSSADDESANGNQKEALAAMKSPLPLYSARFIKPGEEAGIHVYSFAVIEGKVRLLGKMKME